MSTRTASAPGLLSSPLRDWLRDAPPTQLFFLCYGFVPILSLSLALQDIAPLHVTAPVAVIPSTCLALLLGIRRPEWGRRALAGLLSGIVAVALYDVVRLSFVFSGTMPDPMPNIGRMAFGDPNAAWFWGYLWRFVWNGGALGIAFAMLPLRGARAGIGFGLFVCGCLFVTLSASPIAQARFLTLHARNIAIALTGHVVYGAALGTMLARIAGHRSLI
jgi:hypothetical protein